jgi:peptidoglycan hydrolase-like protein with peptidoglycan-binding domain
VVAFAAGALVLVLLVLAVSGVFSSGSSSPSSSSRAGGKTPAASSSARKRASGSPVSLPAGILKQGSSGAPVKQLQLALASAGHSPGPADGVFGLATGRALEAFQRSAGLTADGVYGARTKTALAQALSSG